MPKVTMSPKPLRILVIDRNKIRASIIEEGLRQGDDVDVVIVDELSGLMRHVVDIDPDVIIIDLESPDRDTLEHAFVVSRTVRRPIAMFVDKSDTASTEAAIDAGVSAYVVDGLRMDRVKPILDTAVRRFNAVDRLRRELEEAKSELAERKTIDRAKGILMRTKNLNEEQAYQLLRKTAMNQSRKIAQVAESLVLSFSLLNGEDQK
jgi:two-component system, response regulator / RNA-binding antiterminator